MKDKTILTAESVTAGHPDKLCDTIADTVVDCCLEHDPNARVACEVLATAGKFVVAGEITALTIPDIPSIVRDTVRRAGYNCRNFDVEVLIRPQSPDIAGAVQHGEQTAAGDQGIVYGYACSETENLLPLPVVLAHRLTALLTCARTMGRISGLRPDGKAQVSVEYNFDIPVRLASAHPGGSPLLSSPASMRRIRTCPGCGRNCWNLSSSPLSASSPRMKIQRSSSTPPAALCRAGSRRIPD